MLRPAVGAEDLLSPSRRKILRAATAAVASITLPAHAQTANFWDLPRELWLYRPDINEQVRAVYWADGQLVPEGYDAICRLLRDTHLNLAVQFDIVALDIACGVYGWLKYANVDRPLIIHSGYRHPKTNATEGGAKNSLHMRAQAIDMGIHGVSTESVTRFGLYLAAGGVGFYPGKKFTHLDRGQVRFWRG